MSSYISLTLLSILLSISASASCPVAPVSPYECKGQKLVTNTAELTTYLESFSLNTKKQTIKGVTLSGAFTGSDLTIATPCAISIKSGASLVFSGDVCLSSALKVTGNDNITLKATNATLTSPGRVVLRNNLNATISNDLSLISTGSTLESRAHIRHTSNVTAGSLNVLALRRATLGHSSHYNVSGKITLSSNGEDLPDDAELENSEWSSIWRDTVINTGELSITAIERARIAKNVTVASPKVTISAKSCTLNNTAIIDSPNKLGDCFSGRHPIPKLKYSPKNEATIGQTILLDASKSTYLEGSSFFWSFHESDENIISYSTSIPSTNYSFTTLGQKKMVLKIVTPEGFYHIISRKINITGDAPLQAPVASLVASPSTGEAPLNITLDASTSTDSDGQIVRYIFNDGTNFVESIENTLTFIQETPGTYNYEVEVIDNDGLKTKATTQVIVTPQETDEESALLAFFKFNLIPNGEFYKLELIYESRSLNGKSITGAFYSAGEETLEVGRRVLGHKDVIDFESAEPVDITLTITDELGGSTSYTHTINPINETQRPKLAVDYIEYSANQLVFFSNLIFDPYNQLEDIVGYTLDFGDGNTQELEGPWFQVNHTYANSGDFNVSLTAHGSNDQNFTQSETIEVLGATTEFPFPLADFRVEQESALPGVRLYVDQSLSPSTPIKTYLWNLGDGTTAYGTEVIHFYDEGAYDVTLTAILEDGSSSLVKREVIVMRDSPNIHGIVDCFDDGDLKVLCDFTALDRLGNLSKVSIHFGDTPLGPSSIISVDTSGNFQQFSFEHQYQSAGTFSVSYQVLTDRGEELNGSIDVNISENNGNQNPIADLICYPSFDFVNCHAYGSIDYDGFITNYKFSFGNGESIETNEAQTFYTFPQTGTYQITLEVTDNLGATSTASQIVTIEERPNEFPVPQLTCSSANVQELTCNASSSYDPDGDIVGARITFLEDGEAFESADFRSLNPTKLFTTGGSKSVKLEVEDDQGAIVEVIRDFDLIENSAPFASFDCFSNTKNSLSCDAVSSYDDNAIVNYKWKILGQEYTGITLELSDISQEEVFVELIVEDSFGLINSTTRTIQIKQNLPPVGDFICDGSIPLKVSCTATYTDSDGLITGYEWNVDGQIYSGESIDVTLSSGGIIEVALSVTDDNNSVTTSSKNVNVISNEPPVALFSIDEEVKLRPATFLLDASISSDPDGNSLTYSWSVSNGDTSTGNQFNFTPTIDGVFEITLTVSDGYTQSSISKSVTATSLVQNEILIEKSSEQVPATVFLSPKEKLDPLSNSLNYEWFINGQLYSSEDNVELFVQDIDDQLITLRYTDIYGHQGEVEATLSFEKPSLYFTLNLEQIQGVVNDEYQITIGDLDLEALPSVSIEFENIQNLIISNDSSSSFKVSSPTSSSGEFTIKATDGVNEYQRNVDYQFKAFENTAIDIQLINGEYTIESNGISLGKVKGTAGQRLSMEQIEFNDGSTLVRFIKEESNDTPLTISPIENFSDLEIVDTTPSYSNSLVAPITTTLGYIGETNIKVCPSPRTLFEKSITIGEAARHFIFRPKGPQAKFYNVSLNGTILSFHESSARNYLLPESLLSGNIPILDENKRLVKMLRNVLEVLGFNPVAKVVIGDKDYFTSLAFTLGDSSPALVIPGISAIFINSSLFSQFNEKHYLLYHTLVHELEHISQNNSCNNLEKLTSLSRNDSQILRESYADLKALNSILALSTMELSKLASLENFGNLRKTSDTGGIGFFNADINSLFTTGFSFDNQATPYWHEIHMMTSGYDIWSLTDEVTVKAESLDSTPQLNLHYPTTYFLNRAEMFLEDLIDGKYNIFNFTLEKTSIPINPGDEITMPPFGMKILKVSKAQIIQGAVSVTTQDISTSKGYFRFSTSHSDSISLRSIDNKHAFNQNQITRADNQQGGSTIYSIEGSSPGDFGYIGIFNNSNAEQAIFIKKMDGDLCIQKAGKATQRYMSQFKRCIPCDGLPDKVWSSSTETCVTCPTGNLNSNGTCNYPAPTISVTNTGSIKLDINTCDGLGIGQHELGHDSCSFSSNCENGSIDQAAYDGNFGLRGPSYRCSPNDSGGWDVEKYTSGSFIDITCTNRENETVTARAECN